MFAHRISIGLASDSVLASRMQRAPYRELAKYEPDNGDGEGRPSVDHRERCLLVVHVTGTAILLAWYALVSSSVNPRLPKTTKKV